jgi:hypothetical protein
MFRIGLDIIIPYKKQKNQIDYVEKTWAVSENKSIEIQISKFGIGYTVLCFDLRVRTFTSHAGLTLELGILNRNLIFSFIDNRHWNYEEGRYNREGEED